jgi:TRAP-type C4-dicarboxylate transport system substrate-binding protein
VSLTHHNFGVVLFVCPRNWYLELSEMQRTCLQDAVALATQAQRAQAALEDHRALAELTQHGIAVLNETQIDRPAMHEATRTVRERQLKLLPSPLIDAYLG